MSIFTCPNVMGFPAPFPSLVPRMVFRAHASSDVSFFRFLEIGSMVVGEAKKLPSVLLGSTAGSVK